VIRGLLSLVAGGWAFGAAPQAPPAPVDAALTVRLPAGESTYAMGEIITLVRREP
jgi:hypothetical protein